MLTFLPLGADMNTSVYKAEANDQLLYFIKIKRGHHHDIALYGQDLLLTKAGGGNRAEMYKNLIAMFEPRGVADIAFKTDEEFAKKF